MLSHIFDKPTQSTCSHNVSADYSNILLNSPCFCYYGRFFIQSNRRQADYLPGSLSATVRRNQHVLNTLRFLRIMAGVILMDGVSVMFLL